VSGGVVWVIPCYNEAKRLDLDAFVRAVDDDRELALVFVDDGSRDRTARRLRDLVDLRRGRVAIVSLAKNGGKAEAVRRGLIDAVQSGASVVGYLDADLSTPLSEMRRLTDVVQKTAADVVLGTRVAMLGRNIEQGEMRRYLDRALAQAASVLLGTRVYDTQCGAKVFRNTSALAAALGEPFRARWAFDVELLGRLLVGGEGVAPLDPRRIVEEPLLSFRDMPGSTMRPRDMVGSSFDLVRIARALRNRRKG
jgi:glycosyltransferase involved in cell wall biosynthesis